MLSRPPRTWLSLLLGGAALFAANCSTDEHRTLAYGERVSSGSSGDLTGNSGAPSGDAGGSKGEAGTPHDEAAAGEHSAAVGGQPGGGGNGPGLGGANGAGAASGTASGGTAGAVVGGSGGTSDASAGNSGTGGSSGTGGRPDDGPCGDLDQNGVQDCQETLAKNSTFDASAASWSADPGVTAVWRAEDARGGKASGSVSLTFTSDVSGPGWTLAALGQCVPAWGEQEFEVGARSFIPDGQSGGQAQISLAMFGEDDCAGSFLEAKAPVTSTQSGSWQPLHGTTKMAAGTRSALVRLALSKPGSQASLEVRFDDILIRKK